VPDVSEELQLADGPEAQAGSSGPPYLELWRAARRRKSLIFLGAVAGLVLGALYYATAHPVYEAKAQLLVVRKRPGDVPGLRAFAGAGDHHLSTQAGVLCSRLVVGRAIDEHRLVSLPGLGSTGDLASDIASQLRARRDLKDLHNDVLEVSYRCGDEQSSAAVLSGVIDSFQKFVDETCQAFSKKTVKFVTGARDELLEQLKKKEAAYRAFRHKTPVVLLRGRNGSSFNGDQLLLIHAKQLDRLVRLLQIEDRLREVDKALKDGRSREELTAMISQAMIKTGGDGGSLDSTGRLVNDTLQEKLLPALLEEKMLLKDYGPNHPGVQAAREKVELARTIVLEMLKQEVHSLMASEAALQKAFGGDVEEARKSIDFDTEDDGRRSDFIRLQQLYDVTIERLQDMDWVQDLGGLDAQTISPPVTRKVAPDGTVIFPLALLLGLFLGCGGAYLAEASDKTFRNAEEVRRRLALPVVGHIPPIQVKKETLEAIAASGSELDPMLTVLHRPKSREAEAYRGVRTSLYFSTRGSGRRVIQVTSPSAGDGKSTLTANLAVSIAQSGKRVLLIDADLRKPRVHKIFNIQEPAGLSAVLSGECAPGEAVHDSGVPGLSVMPCGPVPANPAELLTSPRFQEALAILGAQYDFVLLDTPPLLAVTDPSVVAPRVDGVVLTLRITKNGRPQAERAKDILQTLGAPIFGIVVNGIGPARGGSDGYGYDSPDHGDSGRGDSYYEDGESGTRAQGSGPAGAPAGGDGTRHGAASHPGAGDGKS
jgi:capsular exopolysaccharide synthesis family protein